MKSIFIINPHIFQKKSPLIQDEAAKIFTEFISTKKYCGKQKVFWFDIYVEDEINIGRHQDFIHDGYVRLSIHVDKKYFSIADEAYKVKIMLNAALNLLLFLKDEIHSPKDFNTEKLYDEFKTYLKQHNFLIEKSELKQYLVKYFDATRFRFVCTRTADIDTSKIKYDLVDLEDFINNKLAEKKFGKDVNRYDIGHELFDFNGPFAKGFSYSSNIKKYGSKHRYLLVVKQFDYSKLIKMNALEQIEDLKQKIMESFDDLKTLRIRPKNFDIDSYKESIKDTLEEYIKQKYI